VGYSNPHSLNDDGDAQRITLRVSDSLYDEIDSLVEEGPYVSRSEAIRDAVRHLIEDETPHEFGPA